MYPDLAQANAAMDKVLAEPDNDPRLREARREGLRLCREYATRPRDVTLEIHFPQEIAAFAEALQERLNAAVPDADPWASVTRGGERTTLTLHVALTAPEAVLDHLHGVIDLEEQVRGALTALKEAVNDAQDKASAARDAESLTTSFTPEQAYENVLRSGMIRPSVREDNWTCPEGGTLSWSLTVYQSCWLRSVELPPEMEITRVTAAGMEGQLSTEPGTQLVEDGPPFASIGPAGARFSESSRAWKVVPLESSVALPRLLCGTGSLVRIEFRRRAGVHTLHGTQPFRVALHTDELDPYVQSQLAQAQLLAAARACLDEFPLAE